MLTVMLVGAAVVIVSACILADSEWVETVKEVIYLLVKRGDSSEKNYADIKLLLLEESHLTPKAPVK